MKVRKVRVRRKFHFNKLGKAIFAAVPVSVAIIILIIALVPKAQYMAESDVMPLIIETDAVIIRDEDAYYAEFDFGNISFSADEGEQVTAGQELATIYRLGYTEDVAQKLYSVQKEIYVTQTALMSGINKPEVDAAEAKIDALEHELQDAEGGAEKRHTNDIENELKEAVTMRNSLLREMVQPNEKLTSLYAEEETRKKQLSEWSSRIIAGEEGRFSCYMDGLEQSLCMKKLDSITVSQVQNAFEEKGYTTAGNTNNFMYRIIKPESFCIAFLQSATDIPRIYVNEKYNVSFTGLNISYEGTCIKSFVSNKKVLSVIQFSGDMGDLITMRTAKITVSADVRGAKVKSNAISIKDGVAYMNFVTGQNSTEKIAVEVLATNKKYAIIRAVGGERELSGSWYSTRKD
ncbi:MAG: hypothetical protein IJO93_05240 [Clostridia bacterium]|nr:hypothetical protein [Clostridia bacterium]